MDDAWELCDAPFGECGLYTDRNGEPKCTVARQHFECPGTKQIPSLRYLPSPAEPPRQPHPVDRIGAAIFVSIALVSSLAFFGMLIWASVTA